MPLFLHPVQGFIHHWNCIKRIACRSYRVMPTRIAECVGLLKNAIRKCVSSERFATARVRCVSALHVAQVFAEWRKVKDKVGVRKKESHTRRAKHALQFNKLIVASGDVVQDIYEAGNSDKVAGTEIQLASKAKLLFRLALAASHMASVTMRLKQGFDRKLVTSFPVFSETLPACVGVVTMKPVAARAEKAAIAAKERARQAQALRQMTESSHVWLPDYLTMLQAGKHGQNKAEHAWMLLERTGALPPNEHDRRPVYVFTDPKDVPIFQTDGVGNTLGTVQHVAIMDGAQFLAVNVPLLCDQWIVDDDPTLAAKARAVLVMYTRHIQSHMLGGVAAVDQKDFTTWFRSIIWEERGKDQAKASIQAAQYALTKSDTVLKSSLPELLKSKDGFLPLFFEEMAEQALNPSSSGKWDICHYLKDGQFFALTGCSNASIVVTNGTIEFRRKTLSRQQIQNALDGDGRVPLVAQQGEGEAQICTIALRWLELLKQRAGALEARYVAITLVCADVDMLAGRSMTLVHTIKCWFDGLLKDTGVSSIMGTLRLLLVVHKKNDRRLKQLGVLIQKRDGTLAQIQATGENMVAIADLPAMYLALENDNDAPVFDQPGARAIGATAVLLALASNDMKKGIAGVSVKAWFDAFFCKQYRDYIASTKAPIVTASIQSTTSTMQAEYRIGYSAVSGLMFLVLARLPKIARQLVVRYTQTQISKILVDPLDHAKEFDNYTVLRACNFLSVTQHQLPSQVSLLAFAAQVAATFKYWSNWVYKPSPRPETAAMEVEGASFKVVGQHPNAKVEPVFSVILPAEADWRAPMLPEPPDGSETYLARQYPPEILQDRAPAHLFLKPLDVLTEAYERGNGSEYGVKVPSRLVYAQGAILSLAKLGNFLRFDDHFEAYEMDAKMLVEIAFSTISQHGRYNTPLHGSPLITTQTIENLVTNGAGSATWRDSTEEDEDLCAFLERATAGDLASDLDIAVVVNARADTFKTVVETLEKGAGVRGFEEARKKLVAVTGAVVLVAAHARAAATTVGEGADDVNVDGPDLDGWEQTSVIAEITGRPASEFEVDSGDEADRESDLLEGVDGDEEDDDAEEDEEMVGGAAPV